MSRLHVLLGGTLLVAGLALLWVLYVDSDRSDRTTPTDDGTVRVSGFMVDVEGNPIPNLALRLDGSRPTIEVSGDAEGHFVVDNIPPGELKFVTRAGPQLIARGITVSPGLNEVVLVLDWGAHRLNGRVVGAGDVPVPEARVRLSWVHQRDNVTSSSMRIAASNENGLFEFAQLGPGHHRLAVRASGYRTAIENLDLSPTGATPVEVSLEPSTN